MARVADETPAASHRPAGPALKMPSDRPAYDEYPRNAGTLRRHRGTRKSQPRPNSQAIQLESSGTGEAACVRVNSASTVAPAVSLSMSRTLAFSPPKTCELPEPSMKMSKSPAGEDFAHKSKLSPLCPEKDSCSSSDSDSSPKLATAYFAPSPPPTSKVTSCSMACLL